MEERVNKFCARRYNINDKTIIIPDDEPNNLVISIFGTDARGLFYKWLHDRLDGHYTVDWGYMKCWYLGGKLHREGDLPAIERNNGVKEWFIDGNRHRAIEDGPALEAHHCDEWWVNGGYVDYIAK